MNILILGGTGAMGLPLVRLLSTQHTVYVTSRSFHDSTGNVKFIKGNALKKNFLDEVLSMFHWDAIVDFMVYPSNELKELLPLFLDSTEQYVFISSARVYAESEKTISEATPRLLDVSEDLEYLKTDEYALAKAREEDMLFASGRNNFTIVRPSLTYNSHRLQLGVLEKENWLYRALHGRTIVFSEDVNDKLTTMTWGEDVSRGISSIVGERKALGEVFHITYNESLKWSEVLDIYLNVLQKHLGKNVPVVLTKKSTNLNFKSKIYQLIYCRYFNRTFNNSKISHFCDISAFKTPQEGLAVCLSDFLKSPTFQIIDWAIEATNDRVTGEVTPLNEIPGAKNKVNYLLYRYNMSILRDILKMGLKLMRKITNKIGFVSL